MFVTEFTAARHLALSWTKRIHIDPSTLFKMYFKIILKSTRKPSTITRYIYTAVPHVNSCALRSLSEPHQQRRDNVQFAISVNCVAVYRETPRGRNKPRNHVRTAKGL
jgi:hypothetical protein